MPEPTTRERWYLVVLERGALLYVTNLASGRARLKIGDQPFRPVPPEIITSLEAKGLIFRAITDTSWKLTAAGREEIRIHA